MESFKTFTYTISSSESISTSTVCAEWKIRLQGLDPTIKKIYVKVIDFVVNNESLGPEISSYISLGCEGLNDNIISRYGFKHLCFINTNETVCQLFSGQGAQFQCDNFNTKEINFFFIDPDNMKTLIGDINQTATTHWNLVLLITPIDE